MSYNEFAKGIAGLTGLPEEVRTLVLQAARTLPPRALRSLAQSCIQGNDLLEETNRAVCDMIRLQASGLASAQERE